LKRLYGKYFGILIFIIVIFNFGSYGVPLGAEKFPKPVGWVNDFAGVIPPQYRQAMIALITELKGKTGAEIAVVTMPTIGDEDYTDYANRLFEAWGIGEEGKDNGVLIFVTVKERKIRIETGYGVEGILPDGLVGAILDDYAIPFLRKDDYGRGLYAATAAVASIIAEDTGVRLEGMPEMEPIRRPTSGGSPLRALLPIILLLLLFGGGWRILPLLFLGSMIGGRRYGGFGGGFGAGGFGGGFGGFGGGLSGGGGAGRGF